MKRRQAVAAIATAGIGTVAVGGWLLRDEVRSGDGEAGTDTETVPLAEHGTPPTICDTSPLSDPGIYAIDEPVTDTSWDGYDIPERYGTDGELTDDEVVMSLKRDGERRAYPLSIVWHHEIVNDDLAGPVLVTYCPLCDSAMASERRIDGTPATFTVTGQLWAAPEVQTRTSEADNRTFGVNQDAAEEITVRNTGNLVFIDDVTESYWSQILAEAICGPQTGERLSVIPATVATWEEWRQRGDGEVLVPPPHSGTVDPGAQ